MKLINLFLFILSPILSPRRRKCHRARPLSILQSPSSSSFLPSSEKVRMLLSIHEYLRLPCTIHRYLVDICEIDKYFHCYRSLYDLIALLQHIIIPLLGRDKLTCTSAKCFFLWCLCTIHLLFESQFIILSIHAVEIPMDWKQLFP